MPFDGQADHFNQETDRRDEQRHETDVKDFLYHIILLCGL